MARDSNPPSFSILILLIGWRCFDKEWKKKKKIKVKIKKQKKKEKGEKFSRSPSAPFAYRPADSGDIFG